MSLPIQLELLAKQLDKDQSKALVLVGTGVSAGATSATNASWLGLLKHGIRHLVAAEIFTDKHGTELSRSLDAAFTPFKLDVVLQLAEQIESVLNIPNPAVLVDWLESAFSALKVLPGQTRNTGCSARSMASGLLACNNKLRQSSF